MPRLWSKWQVPTRRVTINQIGYACQDGWLRVTWSDASEHCFKVMIKEGSTFQSNLECTPFYKKIIQPITIVMGLLLRMCDIEGMLSSSWLIICSGHKNKNDKDGESHFHHTDHDSSLSVVLSRMKLPVTDYWDSSVVYCCCLRAFILPVRCHANRLSQEVKMDNPIWWHSILKMSEEKDVIYFFKSNLRVKQHTDPW